jgi:p70 ribosomal S6 kinase
VREDDDVTISATGTRKSSLSLSYAAVTTPSSSSFSCSADMHDGMMMKVEEPMIKIAIGPQHFDLLKLIGEGAFGKVIMVKNLLDQKIYAMKVISKKLLKKKNSISYMKSERDILTKVDHPFIVQLFFAFQSEKKIFLVMDFLGGGELFFHLKRR